jgi:hypothetical protein
MMHGGVKTLRITHTFLLGKIFEFTICQTTWSKLGRKTTWCIRLCSSASWRPCAKWRFLSRRLDDHQGRIQTVATVENATIRFSCKNIFNTECGDSKNSL